MTQDRIGKSFTVIFTNGDLPDSPMSLRECAVCGGCSPVTSRGHIPKSRANRRWNSPLRLHGLREGLTYYRIRNPNVAIAANIPDKLQTHLTSPPRWSRSSHRLNLMQNGSSKCWTLPLSETLTLEVDLASMSHQSSPRLRVLVAIASPYFVLVN